MTSRPRVLVTGARGFLGSHLTSALVDREADVYALTRRPAANRGGATVGPSWLMGDLRTLPAVEAVWKEARPDVVFHLTTHGVGSPELGHVQPTLLDDLVATVNVLTVAAREGCGRIVLAASLEEPRGTPPVPASPYAAAKWAATGYARMFAALYATPVVITRPFMTYGPGQQPHKLVPYVIRRLLAGQAPIVSSGDRLVDWVYVDDVVRGLVMAGEREVEGEFDLGTGDLVPVRAVVRQLAALVGSHVPIEFAAGRRPREIERRADASATLAQLGWRAEVPLDEGLRRTVEWCRTRTPPPAIEVG